jgi:glycosyltransferase involved in cell wall biosynthesis
MPVYNSERHISAAIESILNQTLTNLELVICDNASTDDTGKICEAFAARDRRVRYLRNSKNLGANPNYRLAAVETHGEYFKWASSNDLVDSNFLEECINVLDRNKDVVLCYGATMLFQDDLDGAKAYDDNLELCASDPVDRFIMLHERLRLNNVMNGVIRRDVLLQTSLMPNHYSADNIVVAELTLRGKLACAGATRFYRRMDPASATRLQSEAQSRAHLYPEGGLRAHLQTWQLIGSYFRAVRRAPITVRQEVRALGVVAQRAYWNLPTLWRELAAFVNPKRIARPS